MSDYMPKREYDGSENKIDLLTSNIQGLNDKIKLMKFDQLHEDLKIFQYERDSLKEQLDLALLTQKKLNTTISELRLSEQKLQFQVDSVNQEFRATEKVQKEMLNQEKQEKYKIIQLEKSISSIKQNLKFYNAKCKANTKLLTELFADDPSINNVLFDQIQNQVRRLEEKESNCDNELGILSIYVEEFVKILVFIKNNYIKKDEKMQNIDENQNIEEQEKIELSKVQQLKSSEVFEQQTFLKKQSVVQSTRKITAHEEILSKRDVLRGSKIERQDIFEAMNSDTITPVVDNIRDIWENIQLIRDKIEANQKTEDLSKNVEFERKIAFLKDQNREFEVKIAEFRNQIEQKEREVSDRNYMLVDGLRTIRNLIGKDTDEELFQEDVLNFDKFKYETTLALELDELKDRLSTPTTGKQTSFVNIPSEIRFSKKEVEGKNVFHEKDLKLKNDFIEQLQNEKIAYEQNLRGFNAKIRDLRRENLDLKSKLSDSLNQSRSKLESMGTLSDKMIKDFKYEIASKDEINRRLGRLNNELTEKLIIFETEKRTVITQKKANEEALIFFNQKATQIYTMAEKAQNINEQNMTMKLFISTLFQKLSESSFNDKNFMADCLKLYKTVVDETGELIQNAKMNDKLTPNFMKKTMMAKANEAKNKDLVASKLEQSLTAQKQINANANENLQVQQNTNIHESLSANQDLNVNNNAQNQRSSNIHETFQGQLNSNVNDNVQAQTNSVFNNNSQVQNNSNVNNNLQTQRNSNFNENGQNQKNSPVNENMSIHQQSNVNDNIFLNQHETTTDAHLSTTQQFNNEMQQQQENNQNLIPRRKTEVVSFSNIPIEALNQKDQRNSENEEILSQNDNSEEFNEKPRTNQIKRANSENESIKNHGNQNTGLRKTSVEKQKNTLVSTKLDNDVLTMDLELCQKLNVILVENSELKGKLDVKEKRILNLNNDLFQYKKKMRSIANIESKIESLVTQNSRLKSFILELHSTAYDKVTNSSQRVVELNENIQSSEQLLGNVLENNKRLTAAKKHLEKRCYILQNQIEAANLSAEKKEIENIKDNAKMKEKFIIMTEELTSLNGVKQIVVHQAADLKKKDLEIDKISNESDIKSVTIELLERNLAILSETGSHDNLRIRQELENMRKQLIQQLNDRAEIVSEKLSMQTEIDKLRELVKQKDEGRLKLEDINKYTSSKLAEISQEKMNITNEKKLMEMTFHKISNENETLKFEKKAVESEVSLLREKIETYISKFDHLVDDARVQIMDEVTKNNQERFMNLEKRFIELQRQMGEQEFLKERQLQEMEDLKLKLVVKNKQLMQYYKYFTPMTGSRNTDKIELSQLLVQNKSLLKEVETMRQKMRAMNDQHQNLIATVERSLGSPATEQITLDQDLMHATHSLLIGVYDEGQKSKISNAIKLFEEKLFVQGNEVKMFQNKLLLIESESRKNKEELKEVRKDNGKLKQEIAVLKEQNSSLKSAKDRQKELAEEILNHNKALPSQNYFLNDKSIKLQRSLIDGRNNLEESMDQSELI